MFSRITHLPLGVMAFCLIINILIASLWYQPFMLGKAWQNFTGQPIDGPPNPAKLIPAILGTVVYIFTLAILFQLIGIDSLGKGLLFTGFICLGIIAAVAIPIHLYDGFPLKQFIINFGLTLVNFLINGALLGRFS
ncbi:MAG: DUF1761 domain-containing protein [Spirochaetaceae bacterium]|jgi:hypothetical protein|nr:DUF1761 domain-containing protein [Spirochaetaceae bacterium]